MGSMNPDATEADRLRAMLAMGQSQLGHAPMLPKGMCDRLRRMGIADGFTEIKKIPFAGSEPLYARPGA